MLGILVANFDACVFSDQHRVQNRLSADDHDFGVEGEKMFLNWILMMFALKQYDITEDFFFHCHQTGPPLAVSFALASACWRLSSEIMACIAKIIH